MRRQKSHKDKPKETQRVMDLFVASDCGFYEKAEEILNGNQVKIDERFPRISKQIYNIDSTPLHYACRSGHLDIVRLLLDKGADKNALDIERWNPLHYSCNNGHYEITKLLLERGTNTQVEDIIYSQTPLGFAKYRQFQSIVSLMDPNHKIEKREGNKMKDNGNKPVLTKQSPLFLLRYHLESSELDKLREFRRKGEGDDIGLNGIDSVLKDFDGGKVLLHFSHSFDSHCEERERNLREKKEGKRVNHLLRSSTLSSNEHLNVFQNNDIV